MNRDDVDAKWFRERGVALSTDAERWLTRAVYMARTRKDNSHERQQYNWWLMENVMQIVNSGIPMSDINWANMPIVRPKNSPDLKAPPEIASKAPGTRSAVTQLAQQRTAAAAASPSGAGRIVQPTGAGVAYSYGAAPQQRAAGTTQPRMPAAQAQATRQQEIEIRQKLFVEAWNMCNNNRSHQEALKRLFSEKLDREFNEQKFSFRNVTATNIAAMAGIINAPIAAPSPLPPNYGASAAHGSARYSQQHAAPPSYGTHQYSVGGPSAGGPMAHPTAVGHSALYSAQHGAMGPSGTAKREREQDAIGFRGEALSQQRRREESPTISGASQGTRSREGANPVGAPAEKHFERIISEMVGKATAPGKDSRFQKRAGASDGGGGGVIGISDELERMYSRDEPSAEVLRPLDVLRRAFSHILLRARTEFEGGDVGDVGGHYLSQQLKGMRQDLLIQGIRNPFTVQVYEKHARLCLQRGDLSEFNQCQASLKQFYHDGIRADPGNNVVEFTCYRLVYLALREMWDALATELVEIERGPAFEQDVADGEAERLAGVSGEVAADGKSFVSQVEQASAKNPVVEAALGHLKPAYRQMHEEVMQTLAGLREHTLIRDTLQLCAAIQHSDSRQVVILVASLGALPSLLDLVNIFLERLRISWIESALVGVKGEIPWWFVLESLGFAPVPLMPNGRPNPRVQKNDDKRKVSGARVAVPAGQVFLDGGLEAAENAFIKLMRTLSRSVPKTLSFRLVVMPPTQSKRNETLVDPKELVEGARKYVEFLTTRADVRLDNKEGK